MNAAAHIQFVADSLPVEIGSVVEAGTALVELTVDSLPMSLTETEALMVAAALIAAVGYKRIEGINAAVCETIKGLIRYTEAGLARSEEDARPVSIEAAAAVQFLALAAAPAA